MKTNQIIIKYREFKRKSTLSGERWIKRNALEILSVERRTFLLKYSDIDNQYYKFLF